MHRMPFLTQYNPDHLPLMDTTIASDGGASVSLPQRKFYQTCHLASFLIQFCLAAERFNTGTHRKTSGLTPRSRLSYAAIAKNTFYLGRFDVGPSDNPVTSGQQSWMKAPRLPDNQLLSQQQS